MRRYCERTGLATPEALKADWNFYMAYNMFRIGGHPAGHHAKRVRGRHRRQRRRPLARPPARRRWPEWPGASPWCAEADNRPPCQLLTRTPLLEIMDFDYTPKYRNCGRACRPSWTSTSIPTKSACSAKIADNRRQEATRWIPTELVEELKPQARAAGLWNLFLPAVRRARRRPLQPRIRAAVRDHGPRALGARRCSTARRPTPATWKCWRATAREAQKDQWLEPLLRRRDPLGLRDDRAGGGLVRRDQHRDAASCATATSTCINGRKWWILRRRRSALRRSAS